MRQDNPHSTIAASRTYQPRALNAVRLDWERCLRHDANVAGLVHYSSPSPVDWRLDDVVDDEDDPLVCIRGKWVRKSVIDKAIQDAFLDAERQGILSRDPKRPGVWRSNIYIPKLTDDES